MQYKQIFMADTKEIKTTISGSKMFISRRIPAIGAEYFSLKFQLRNF